MSRLHVIRDLVYQGPPQVPETLENDYLIFTASIDGDPDTFLRDVARLLGPDADAIFSHTVGFPGTADAGAFATWALEHKATTATSSLRGRSRPFPRPRGAARPGGLRRAGLELAPSSSDAELQAQFRALMAGGK